MKLTDATWNEMEGFTNNPRLEASVSEIPGLEGITFREYEFSGSSNLYVGEHDGRVKFFSHPGDDENAGGFGGRSYTLTMEDGSTKVLRGPYSSRAGVVNARTTHDCVKVHQMDGASTLHVTKALAERAADMAGRELVKQKKYDDEIYWRFE